MEQYKKVANVSDLPPGTMMTVEKIDRVDVCVLNLNGSYFAVSNICTHKGGPLNRGTINGKYLVCPWHKASFRLEDGKGFWPAEKALRKFELKVVGEELFIKLPSNQD